MTADTYLTSPPAVAPTEGAITALVTVADERRPRQVGPYRVLEQLGRGGMGTVYQAEHEVTGETVALKLLSAEFRADTTAVARFRRETTVVGRLEHPQIAAILDHGESPMGPYMVLELVEGCDLSKLGDRRAPLLVADCCEIIRQAAWALDYVHQQGVVHRDVKPANLMVSRDGGVKLLDFGLAYEPATGRDESADAVQIVGTPDYLSPEQILRSDAVDRRSDVYGLGCTLFQLLTGRAPFHGPAYQTAAQKLLAHLERPFPDCRTWRPEVPPSLTAVLARAVAKDPHHRFPTAAALAAALAPYTDGAALEALPAVPRLSSLKSAESGSCFTDVLLLNEEEVSLAAAMN